MAISCREFGKLANGRKIDVFTLTNKRGVSAEIISFGGRLVSVRAPDRRGDQGHVVLGFDTWEKYIGKRHFHGALVGRVANRIRNGLFTLEGKKYQLYVNPENGQHLHGGEIGFSAKAWDANIDGASLRLNYVSPDGEEHYPGRLEVAVWYSLDDESQLTIKYSAVTDKTTIVNLTNHAFFNLNCCRRDVLGHELMIRADRYTPVDDKLVPTGEIRTTVGTPMDFAAAKPIGRDLAAAGGGYDHNFIFAKKQAGALEWLVEVHDPDSGRTMAMATTEPCTQFYSGNFLDGSDVGHDGAAYGKYYGFCLEAQHHPDAVNHPNFPSIVLKPGETYSQTTIYKFGVKV